MFYVSQSQVQGDEGGAKAVVIKYPLQKLYSRFSTRAKTESLGTNGTDFNIFEYQIIDWIRFSISQNTNLHPYLGKILCSGDWLREQNPCFILIFSDTSVYYNLIQICSAVSKPLCYNFCFSFFFTVPSVTNKLWLVFFCFFFFFFWGGG